MSSSNGDELQLFVKIDGDFKPVSALMADRNLKAITHTTIHQAIERYIAICSVKKCKKNYSWEVAHLEKFKKFLESKDIFCVHQVKKIDLLEYKNQLYKTMVASSVNRRFDTVKHFFKMCFEWDFTHENVALNIKKEKITVNKRKVWSEEDFEKVYEKCNDFHRKVLKFLYLSGCRPSELANLKWTDIDFDQQIIKFSCGKNKGNAREFPLFKKLGDVIHTIEMRGIYVFTKDGSGQIRTDALSTYIREKLKLVKLDHLVVYGLRHTFAYRLSKAGISAFDIMDHMGHSNVQTTLGYAKEYSKKRLKDQLDCVI